MKQKNVSYIRLTLGIGVLLLLLGAFGTLISKYRTTGEPVTINGVSVPPVPTLNVTQVEIGAGLYAKHCATCHGASLEGQPNWKMSLEDGSLPAPPHDGSGHTWHHSDGLILDIIANGGDPAYNSKMPAFKDQLSKQEMSAILAFIKTYWEDEQSKRQWWMTVTQDNQ
jgi:mono/diheme cytochrome c family protein